MKAALEASKKNSITKVPLTLTADDVRKADFEALFNHYYPITTSTGASLKRSEEISVIGTEPSYKNTEDFNSALFASFDIETMALEKGGKEMPYMIS